MSRPKPRLNIKEAICQSHEMFIKTVFEKTSFSQAERKMVQSFLSDPLFRPLCELAANGLTSFEGALILTGANMINRDEFVVRKGPATNAIVTTCQINQTGHNYLEAYLEPSASDERVKFVFEIISSFQSYAAIDNGAGIAASRSAVECALEFEDWELLKRIRDVPSGLYNFNNIACSETIDPDLRSQYMDFVTIWEHNRTGADVIDLFAKGLKG